jgi:organic hydroperoxide reductase OsmC/OhrA
LIEVDHAFNRATGNGTNPEQLFAAGWSACFISAIKIAAARMKVTLPAHLTLKPDQRSSGRILAGKDSSGI